MSKAFAPVSALNVMLDFEDEHFPVGRLARRDAKIFFEYDADFIARKLELSPFKLPLGSGLQVFEPGLFEGLPGLFNDSLPDGWGRLLLDRALSRKGITPESFSPLDRLAHVGASGMGALVYAPDYSEDVQDKAVNLDALADQSQKILEGNSEEVFEELLALGGGSQGRAPKP